MSKKAQRDYRRVGVGGSKHSSTCIHDRGVEKEQKRDITSHRRDISWVVFHSTCVDCISNYATPTRRRPQYEVPLSIQQIIQHIKPSKNLTGTSLTVGLKSRAQSSCWYAPHYGNRKERATSKVNTCQVCTTCAGDWPLAPHAHNAP